VISGRGLRNGRCGGLSTPVTLLCAFLGSHRIISLLVYLVRCDNSHLAECETYHLTPIYTKQAGTTTWETTYRIFRRG
jgi:hypothetical protein